MKLEDEVADFWAQTDPDPMAEVKTIGPDVIVSTLKGLLNEYYKHVCYHDETHRGGSIWTFCDQCGAKWSDDRNPFKPYVDPPIVAQANFICDVLIGGREPFYK